MILLVDMLVRLKIKTIQLALKLELLTLQFTPTAQ